ncbi:MAG: hypothetical protein ABIN94_02555 [Ferruginibacter sp.]
MAQERCNDNPHLWMRSMRQGDFPVAWQHCDKVLESRAGKPCWHLPRHFQYIWNGTPLEGKRVLVRCYHGLGDTIQFARYLPVLKEITTEVIVWVQPKLIPLLQSMCGISELLALHDGTPQVDFEVDVEIMELPYIFRSTINTIPAQVPYLHITRHPIFSNKKKHTVGLVWKSGDWDENRSIPFSLFLPLAEIKEIDFYMLQHEAEHAGWQHQFGIYPGELPIVELAEYIAGLDLLISIDSMPVHLAGALGVPVWTMLQAEADWRWMENTDRSPWYPTMRLFRQHHQGDWVPVINAIYQELKTLTPFDGNYLSPF